MQPGTLVARKYRLVRRLAEGGMAEVWAAENQRTGRAVAIKFLLERLNDHPQALSRFRREARASGAVRHENVIDVLDAGQTPEGRPYLVMELLAGESVEQRLTRVGKLSALEACALLAQVAAGLEAAHAVGIVHRDLSSANVFLVDRPGALPQVKIIDFGVCKVLERPLDDRVITGEGAIVGSPAFMSPEQAKGAESVDARADLWALGVLGYQCLTGELPFKSRNYTALMLAVVSAPHRHVSQLAPGLDPELVELIEGCLVKDPEGRLASARHLRQQLERLAHRLARHGADARYVPKRRLTDRLQLPPGAQEERRASAPSGLRAPWIEAALDLCSEQRVRTFGAFALAVGAVFGLFLGVSVATARTEPPKLVTVVVPQAPAPGTVDPLEPKGRTSVESAPKIGVVAAAPAAPSSRPLDLVDAVARGSRR